MFIDPGLQKDVLQEIIQVFHVSDHDGRVTQGKLVSQEELEAIFGEKNTAESRKLVDESENPFEFYILLKSVADT